jgi:hypothetical protein
VIQDRCIAKAGDDDVAKCKCRADYITNLAGSLHIGCDDSVKGEVGYEEFCGSFDLATRSNLCLFCKVLEELEETPCSDHYARNTCKEACSSLDEL